MNVFIFKTDLKDKKQVDQLKSSLEQEASIIRWAVDLLDRDRILKLVTTPELTESMLIQRVRQQGIQCESLPE